MVPYRSVLITGASSGIGRALAEACAAPGVALHLSGRDAGRLAEVEAGCTARGAKVEARVLDVTDAAAMAVWIAVGRDGSTWWWRTPAFPPAPAGRRRRRRRCGRFSPSIWMAC